MKVPEKWNFRKRQRFIKKKRHGRNRLPVVRRFDGSDLEPLAEKLQGFQNDRQPVWQSFPEQLLVAPTPGKGALGTRWF